MNKTSILIIFLIILLSNFFTSCSTSRSVLKKNRVEGDTITLQRGIPLYDSTNRFIAILDSVLADSRCPKGVRCIWEGNATVKINFNNLQKAIQSEFTLDTHPMLNSDTTLNNYYIKLLELTPYPEHKKKTRQQNYSAKIIVKEI